jgi:hypothetical protein
MTSVFALALILVLPLLLVLLGPAEDRGASRIEGIVPNR